ncbi:MAG: HlyD family efflux transporter periplasmic adaptor subunit [Planctomycetota bacterium]|nr:MAG: HlyD family efflux transporter periplasmic adaptor subunit [Planctomycetota bacterium]
MDPHSFPVDSDPASFDWHAIEDRLDELATIASSNVTAEEFYRAVLERIAPAVGVTTGAIWTAAKPNQPRLDFALNLSGNAEQLARHQALVEAVLAGGQPRIVQPEGSQSGLDSCVVLHPFSAAAGTPGVIELVGRREISAAAARGTLQVLAAVAELAADYHKNDELRRLRTGAQNWHRYEQFAKRVHRSLELREAAYLIANDGRKIIGCDRASVLLCQGSKCRALAISGVDTFDRRSKSVRALETLAARVAACDEAIWYHDGTADMPDEITRPLAAYLDESHSRALCVLPLREPTDETAKSDPRVIGVLVAEHFQAASGAGELRDRITSVGMHAEVALHNALVHTRQPLAWLGRMLARIRWLGEPRQLPVTVTALLAVAGVAALLTFVPADFDIESRGEFQPSTRREVFASDDGVVDQLLIDPGASVQAGQPLVVLRNPEIELELRRLAGEMRTAEKKLASVRAERLLDAPAQGDSRRDPHELAAEEEQLKELLTGLRQQQLILEEQQAELTIRSPIDGDSLTWDVKQLLESRPVQRGQALVEVADLDGPWVLELHLADDRTGHVLAARDGLKPDLDVAFALSSDPAKKYQGRIAKVAPSTEMDESGEPFVLVTVEFDRDQVPALRPGATALARIHCGRRAVGYVWLHELFEYVHSLWW